MSDSDNVLFLERVISAPREKVFKAWSDPKQLVKWWGPNGFTTPVCEMDFRVGGKTRFCMRSPDGQEIWCGGVYKEIVENERIVCTDYFTDPEGNVVSPEGYGMSDWPVETIIEINFEDLDGRTRLTVRHYPVAPSKDRENANEGWSQTLDRLVAYAEQET